MRTLLLLAALCVAILAAPGSALAKLVPMADAGEISGVVGDKLHADDFNCSMVGEPPYAVVYWKAGKGYAPGNALVEKTHLGWQLIELSKTSLKDAAALQGLGVPVKTAQALVADLNNVGQ